MHPSGCLIIYEVWSSGVLTYQHVSQLCFNVIPGGSWIIHFDSSWMLISSRHRYVCICVCIILLPQEFCLSRVARYMDSLRRRQGDGESDKALNASLWTQQFEKPWYRVSICLFPQALVTYIYTDMAFKINRTESSDGRLQYYNKCIQVPITLRLTEIIDKCFSVWLTL